MDSSLPLVDLPIGCPPRSSTDPYPWLHMSTPEAGTIITRLGHAFQWKEEHPKLEYLLTLREIGDPTVDELLPRLHANFTTDCVSLVAQRAARYRQSLSSDTTADIQSLSADEISADAECYQFMQNASIFPKWVDWSQVDIGQRIFRRSCQTSLMALMYRSD
jgi:hypothetical protein